MFLEKFLKSKLFLILFILWAAAINIFYYLQFKETILSVLKKMGIF